MEINISYTVQVDDDTRRAISSYYGRPGLASRSDVQNWFTTHGESMDDELAEIVARRRDLIEREGEIAWPRPENAGH